jgi:hypothetical protein
MNPDSGTPISFQGLTPIAKSEISKATHAIPPVPTIVKGTMGYIKTVGDLGLGSVWDMLSWYRVGGGPGGGELRFMSPRGLTCPQSKF